MSEKNKSKKLDISKNNLDSISSKYFYRFGKLRTNSRNILLVPEIMIEQIVNDCVLFGLKHGYDKLYNKNLKNEDEPDVDKETWKKFKLKNESGIMPWDSFYEILRTPRGRPYLRTLSPIDEYGMDYELFTFYDGRETRSIEMNWDLGSLLGVGKLDKFTDKNVIKQIEKALPLNMSINQEEEDLLIDALIDENIEEFVSYKIKNYHSDKDSEKRANIVVQSKNNDFLNIVKKSLKIS